MTEATQTRTDTSTAPVAAAEPSPAERVQQAATRAAEGVEGVHELGTAGGRALVRAMGRVPGGRTTYGPGVSVEVGKDKAAVDLTLVAEYGTKVPALAAQVRDAVRKQVEREARLKVVEVNVTVRDIHHPDDDIAAARRAEALQRAQDAAKDVAGRAQQSVQGAAERTQDAVQGAAERTQDAAQRVREQSQDVVESAKERAEDGRAEAAAAVRDADAAVKRIAAQAAEAAAAEEGSVDGAQSDETSASNKTREERDAPTVVLGDGSTDGPGPDVVVADQVVIADRVVVVEDDQDEDNDQERDRRG